MQLKTSNTKWVFFLGASNGVEPENRHVFDIAYGIKCIESTGASPSDIEAYIDGGNRENIAKLISTGSLNNHKIQSTQDFFKNSSSNKHENIIIFISGHGDFLGIDADPQVSPHRLLSCLKSTPSLKNSIVFLGQCYAGTFNYTGAGKKQKDDVDVIFIGATSLHSSLSSTTTEIFANNQEVSWVANVFLLYVFKWIEKPIDIDGDGRNTIIDCYKFAGCMANNFNKNRRLHSFDRSLQAREKHSQAAQRFQLASATFPQDPTQLQIKQLELAHAQQEYLSSCDIYHTHQECWILNSMPAQHIEL